LSHGLAELDRVREKLTLVNPDDVVVLGLSGNVGE
jgi:hypothetical protein